MQGEALQIIRHKGDFFNYFSEMLHFRKDAELDGFKQLGEWCCLSRFRVWGVCSPWF